MSKRRRNKQKRAYLKKWASDYIKTNRIDHSKTVAYEIFQNRARVRTDTGPFFNKEPKQDHSWADYVTYRCGCERESKKPFFCKECGTHAHVVSRASKIPATSAKQPLVELESGEIVLSTQVTPRQAAMDTRATLMQSERLQSVEQFHVYVKIFQHGDDYLRLYYQGNVYFFEQKHGTVVQKSCVYRGRDRAMAAFNTDRILWMQTRIVSK